MMPVKYVSTSPSPGLEKIANNVGDVPWILGSVNIDEHPLFSHFYIGASQDKATRASHLNYPGYSQILAVYENGVEQYYVPLDEAKKVSDWLIDYFLANPQAMQGTLDSITEYSERLATIFPENINFNNLSRDELLFWLLKHNEIHEQLYEHARIPEALDRGLPFFTNYLKDYLRKIGVTESALPYIFEDLTKPKKPSIFREEKNSLQDIAETYRNVLADIPPSRHTAMFLPPEVLRTLRDHQERYKWLNYHGYRGPDLPPLQNYIDKLFKAAAERNIRRAFLSSGALKHEQEDREFLSSIFLMQDIDDRHKALFDAYSEISRVKVVRRYWQLRNFYSYDKLLTACADKLGVREIDVRCCMPRELKEALETNNFDPAIKDRADEKCVILYDDDGQHILTGENAKELLENLDLKAEIDFKHTTICTGYAQGIARHIINQNSTIQSGDIAICPSADPDLVAFFSKAAGVVCADPGVTGHGALVLREMGIPAIAVHNALEKIPSGAIVEMNATEGTYKIIYTPKQSFHSDLIVPKNLWDSSSIVGNKASNLERATLHYRVPGYMLLDYDIFASRLADDQNLLKDELVQLAAPLLQNVSKGDEKSPLLLFRSSALDEDNEQSSMAGNYTSVVVNSMDDLIPAAQRFVNANSKKGYKGAVIFQRFMPALACGVCLYGAPSLGENSHKKIIIEIAHGPHNRITEGGDENIERLEYDITTGDVTTTMNGGSTQAKIPEFSSHALIKWLRTMLEHSDSPQDVEWGFDKHGFWLYQQRDVVVRPRLESNFVFSIPQPAH